MVREFDKGMLAVFETLAKRKDTEALVHAIIDLGGIKNTLYVIKYYGSERLNNLIEMEFQPEYAEI